MEKALIVAVGFEGKYGKHLTEEDVVELEQLSVSAGTQVVGCIRCRCKKPSPNLLIGKGKAGEIENKARELKANCVVFDVELSSSQQRNLEDILDIKTIDRTQLILDIFSKRAKSQEGKVQVELAQLVYLLPRLAGKGILLSRLGGGIGTRGPGEQKLEVDRRRIRKRITHLKNDLKDLKSRRGRLRAKRQSIDLPTIALVGYTNAGKSTLLNRLTGAEAIVANSLFSTLDPLARRFILPNGLKVLFLDTVGFLNRLPHYLIEAFHATLEEVIEADVLLHVLDITSNRITELNEAVYNVLKELHIEDKTIVTVLNKRDLAQDIFQIQRIARELKADAIISARTGEGLSNLIDSITGELKGLTCEIRTTVPLNRMDILHQIYDCGQVLLRQNADEGIIIKAIVPRRIAGYFESQLENPLEILDLKTP